MQGYNAQAVVTEDQVVVAAALTREANDLQQLAPMLAAVDQALASAQISDRPRTLVADSGYWSIANLTSIPEAPELLIWPAKTGRTECLSVLLATAVHGAATPALCWMTLHRACFPSRRRQWFERRPRATTTSGAGLRRFVHA